MTRTIAVTGVDGFVGRHLAALAHEAGVGVVGLSRTPLEDPQLKRILTASVAADLTHEWPPGIEVDAIVHLAGLAAVGPSFDRPQAYISANSSMVTHLAEALLASDHPPRLIAVSTGAVYGASSTPLPEDAPVVASSPYVVSKLLVENQLRYYALRGLDVVAVRPFNHLGPGQSRGFLLPDLVAALRTHRGSEPLPIGNLNAARDYTDVRDVARAYLSLALSSASLAPCYNVASGRALSGWDILGLAAEALGISVPETRVDESRLRATDTPVVVGDAQRLADDIGWFPSIPVQRSVAEYVSSLIEGEPR